MFQKTVFKANESVLLMEAFGETRMVEILSARQKLPNLIQNIVQERLQQKQWGALSREEYPGLPSIFSLRTQLFTSNAQ